MAGAAAAAFLASCQWLPPQRPPIARPVPEAPGPEAPSRPPPAPPPGPAEAPREAPPQQQASASLTRNGRALLEAGRIDAAIREFERAVGLNPHHGPGYFYLAKAWMAKGDWSQAASFHRQAEVHLRGDAQWAERLRFQGAEIRMRSAGGD